MARTAPAATTPAQCGAAPFGESAVQECHRASPGCPRQDLVPSTQVHHRLSAKLGVGNSHAPPAEPSRCSSSIVRSGHSRRRPLSPLRRPRLRVGHRNTDETAVRRGHSPPHHPETIGYGKQIARRGARQRSAGPQVSGQTTIWFRARMSPEPLITRIRTNQPDRKSVRPDHPGDRFAVRRGETHRTEPAIRTPRTRHRLPCAGQPNEVVRTNQSVAPDLAVAARARSPGAAPRRLWSNLDGSIGHRSSPGSSGRLLLAYSSRRRRITLERNGQMAEQCCVCGHARQAHLHYRRGSECSLCDGGCPRFRRATAKKWFIHRLLDRAHLFKRRR